MQECKFWRINLYIFVNRASLLEGSVLGFVHLNAGPLARRHRASGRSCIGWHNTSYCTIRHVKCKFYKFDVSGDRASWYISIVKPTRCTIFRVHWISRYMFRTVFPSIVRSSRLYIQHQVYVIQVPWLLASGHEMELISDPLASSQLICMTYIWRCMYSLELLMMDGKTVRNM